jgi:hypothetical protein
MNVQFFKHWQFYEAIFKKSIRPRGLGKFLYQCIAGFTMRRRPQWPAGQASSLSVAT